jgi:hypothetical protein
MNSYDNKVQIAMGYIDAIYRIETMRTEGVTGLYGLEQHRLQKHGELCEALMINREKTKDICLNLDKSIGFNLDELNKDFDFYLEKYAKRLVEKLAQLM